MNKKEMLDYIEKTTGVSFDNVEKVYNAIFDLIKKKLINGDNINIVGLGTFRIGIKPSTGEIIEIKARRVVTFKPSPSLKKLVNDKTSDNLD